MAIARLSGGPLDGQILPIEPGVDDSLIVPYGEGQLVYHRAADVSAVADGPRETVFEYVEATEDINPDPDGRDD